MNKKIILYFLAANFYSIVLSGQNDSSSYFLSSILNKVNKNFSNIKKGGFKLTYKFKPLTDEDTIIHTADCKFYKNNFKGEIADFIIYADSQPKIIYQDKKFYQIYHKEKKILKKDVYNGNLTNLASGYIDHELIFMPYFKVSAPLFDSIFYSDYKFIRTINEGKSPLYEIRKSDSDTDNVVDNIPGKIRVDNIIEKIYVDATTFFVRKKIDELDFQDMHQYIEYELSDVENLGEKAKPDFPTDELLKKYAVYDNEIDLSISDKKINRLAIGDSVSLNKIKTIMGETIDLQNCNSRLILFDFWYKSCYPCLLALPHINELRKKYDEKSLFIIGINPYDKDINKIKSFIKTKEILFPVVIDSLKEITSYFGVSGFPSIFLIDTETHKIISFSKGFNEGELKETEEKIKKFKN